MTLENLTANHQWAGYTFQQPQSLLLICLFNQRELEASEECGRLKAAEVQNERGGV